MKSLFSFFLLSLLVVTLEGQTTNDVLNLLIQNNTISQEQADSLRAEAAIADQANQSKIKTFAVNAAKKMQLAGYAHLRYQFLEEEGKIDGIDIRRAYFDIKANITSYWSFRLQTDFAGTPKIVDVYTDLKIYNALNFSIGQQAIPFSLNNTTSNTKLELADRSQVVEALSSRKGDVLGDNNGRDIGLTVYGSLLPINKLNLIEYRIGIFNGSGINKSDLNEAKDIIGRIILHPFAGLDVGGSFYSGWTPDSATLNNKTIPALLGLRQRVGAELNYTFRFLNIKGEFITGTDGKVKKTGYYGQVAAYIISNKLQIAGRYDSYDKDTDKDDNILTNYTFGVNYFINPNVVLQGAYTFRQEEGTAVTNNIGSVQLQIGF